MLRISEIPKKPNKGESKKAAYEFIFKNIDDLTYPVDPEMFFPQNCCILSWSEANEVYGTSDTFNLKGKKAEARTRKSRSSNSYITIYDDTLNNKDRIRFTKAHELGHIILGHLNKYEKTAINRGGLSDKEYKVLEFEADFFASQLLSPVPLIQLLELTSVENIKDIKRLFQISPQAARNRFVDILWYGKSNFYADFRPKFKALFYNRIMLYKYGYSCNFCGHISTNRGRKVNYCPLCGKDSLNKIDYIDMGENDLMKHEEVHIKICSNCDNDEIEYNHKYCFICRKDLRNHCTGDDMTCALYADDIPLKNNARFCPMCGSKSTFFKDDVLTAWDYQEPIIFDTTDEEDLPF